MVAVFDQPASIVRAPRAEIDTEEWVDLGDAAPIDEFVGSEGIRLGREPGEVEPP
jgi:hypothetical protein